MTKKVVLFGDSILKGVILGEDGRYHISKNINWAKIEQQLDISIENLSKMGSCIGQGREKLEKYLETNHNIDSIVLEYGGNDSDYFWHNVSKNPHANNLPKTDLNIFREILIDMVNMTKKHGIKPILMTLPPIIADRYFDFIVNSGNDSKNIKKFLGDIQIIYRRQEMYSNEIQKVAYMLDVDIVDVRQKFLKSDNLDNLYCIDGIHPNNLGQDMIVDAFLDYFSKLDKTQRPQLRSV